MKNLGLEFRVGLFTILGVITAGFLIWFVDPSRFEGHTNLRYYTVLRDASGIVAKTHVRTNGVTVGRVVSVNLIGDESRTRVDFEVDEAIKLPVGSQIDVRTVGLLGDKFIEIIRTESAPDGYIEPGGVVPRASGGFEINEIMNLAGGIAQDVKKITASLAETLGERSGQDKLANILDNVEAITENLNAVLVDNRSDFRSVIANLRDTTDSIQGILSPDNRQRFERIIASFDESMEDVKGTTKNIRLIAEKVQSGEGTIGKLISDEDTIAEFQGAISDVRRILGPTSRLKINVDYRLEARNIDIGTAHYFNLGLKTRPDRQYIIGLTTARYAYEDKIVEDYPPSENFGGEAVSRTRTYTRHKGEILINLQLAKRWHFIQARFGLFESTGGVAADVYAWRDRIKLSLEAMDIQTTNNEVRRVGRLRGYASILFFNHIYAIVGFDDPTRYDRETGAEIGFQNYFFGTGFNFDDDDLRAIFGVAAAAAI